MGQVRAHSSICLESLLPGSGFSKSETVTLRQSRFLFRGWLTSHTPLSLLVTRKLKLVQLSCFPSKTLHNSWIEDIETCSWWRRGRQECDLPAALITASIRALPGTHAEPLPMHSPSRSISLPWSVEYEVFLTRRACKVILPGILSFFQGIHSINICYLEKCMHAWEEGLCWKINPASKHSIYKHLECKIFVRRELPALITIPHRICLLDACLHSSSSVLEAPRAHEGGGHCFLSCRA